MKEQNGFFGTLEDFWGNSGEEQESLFGGFFDEEDKEEVEVYEVEGGMNNAKKNM